MYKRQILAIRALKAHCLAAGLGESDTLEIILRSVVGIDLNPLAVLAARVNYLLAIADLVPYRRRPIEIPIYLADSILTPIQGADLFTRDRRVLKTSVGELPVPAAVDTREEMEALTTLLEEYVRGGFSADVFVQRARAVIKPADAPGTEAVLRELFEKLVELERQAHELAAAGDKKALKAVEAEVDQAAAELWEITEEELAEIRRSLEELRG